MNRSPAASAPWRAACTAAVAVGLCSAGTAADADVTLFFGGDTSHGESYQDRKLREGGRSVLVDRPYDEGFQRLLPLMRGVDYTVLNLETPLTKRRVSPIEGKPSYLYSDPEQAPASLLRLGVDAVTIANNHALDFGPAGLRDTLSALAEAPIACFGAGNNLASAERPLVLELGSEGQLVCVALLGAFERRDWYEPFNFYATGKRPGVNPIDTTRLARQIAQLKSQNPKPFVIVTPHWGENYVWRVSRLRKLAEAMIDAGADMIIGHGAHRLQEIDRIRGRWVFYSIGNLVFNSDGAFAKHRSTPFSLPLRVTLRRTPAGYDVGVRGYPIHGDNLTNDYRPRPASLDEARQVRRLLTAYDSSGSLRNHARWGRDELGFCVALGSARAGLEALPPSPTQGNLIQPGEGRFRFDADGEPPIDVWTYRPRRHGVDGPVLIVMHGTLRNADEYRDAWIGHAERLGALLLTPEFPSDGYPSGHGYQQLNILNGSGTPTPQRTWGSRRVEALFEHVADALELRTGSYYLYGHSAGGQFVHRSMLLTPSTRARLAIAANAGWYTMPDFETQYPAGLAGSHADEDQLGLALGRQVVVLLGTADNDPQDPYLSRSDAAMRQGPHRLARGKEFFGRLQQAAEERGVALDWRLELAEGVGHSNADMAALAARLIEADLAPTNASARSR